MGFRFQSWIAPLLAALMLTAAAAQADDVEIYTNPNLANLAPPSTVLVIDLNLIGICDNVITGGSSNAGGYNSANPLAAQACINLRAAQTLNTYLTSIGLGASSFLTTVLKSMGAAPLCSLASGLNLLTQITGALCATVGVLLPSVLNNLLGSLVGVLVTPLLAQTLNALPTALLGALDTSLSVAQKLLADPASVNNLADAVGAILNNLLYSNVAIVISHSNRANNGAQLGSGSACNFTVPRRSTASCANGAFFLVGFTTLADTATVAALVDKVSNLLGHALAPQNLVPTLFNLIATGLNGDIGSLTPPYQGKEIYDEIIHYVTGDALYNAPLGNVSGNLRDGLFSLLSRDTTIDNGSAYLKPSLQCPAINVLNLQITNSSGDNDSDTDLARYFPGVNLQPTSPASGFANLVNAASVNGFTSTSDSSLAYSLKSYFVVQETLTSLSALNTVADNLLTYTSTLGLLGMGSQIAQMLQPSLSVNASLLTPSQTVSLTMPGAVRPESYFSLFRPAANQKPRWPGNLKKLRLATDSNDAFQYYDANGATAIAADGRIKNNALSYWTDTLRLGNVTADGRNATLGGAGQMIPGYVYGGGGNPGRANSDGRRKLYYDRIASGSFGIAALDANTATTSAVLELSADLGASAESASVCGAAKSQAQVAQETLLYARGYDTGSSCSGSKGASSSVVGRDWLHGAVLHSRPVAINYGARSGYTAASPDIRVLYGSTDGYLRLLRNSDGVESWGFMPRVVMSQQKQLRDNRSVASLPYGVDGAPSVLLIDRNTSGGGADGVLDASNRYDHVWAYFGLRRSGRYYYAMDLGDPDAPSLLWRIGPDGLYNSAGLVSGSAADYAELALTFSTPQIGRINNASGVARPVLIFGGGYNGGRDSSGNRVGKDLARGSDGVIGSDDNFGNALFVVDAETGALIWKATLGSASYNAARHTYQSPLLNDSLAADLTIVDSDGDGLTDRVYAVDTGGRLWRGDITGSDVSRWTLAPLASVGRHRSATVADDRRFFHAPDYAPVRSFSGNYDEITFGSGDREDPTNVATANYFYAYRDGRTASGPATSVATRDADLKANQDFVDLSTLCATGTPSCTAGKDLSVGWRIKLGSSGEKTFSQPLSSSGTVYFTAYTPPAVNRSACVASEGSSRLYGIALADSRPTVSSFVLSGAAQRSLNSSMPGMPGDVNPLNATAIAANTQSLKLDALLPYTVYWRERRNDDETPPR
jgi:type IV pilus assembly protein PilY1